MSNINLFEEDREADLQELTNSLQLFSDIMNNLQNRINRQYSLDAYQSHKKKINDKLKTIINQIANEALPYMDREVQAIKNPDNYTQTLFELAAFRFLKHHNNFELLKRPDEKKEEIKKCTASNYPDFEFFYDDQLHYFECTTRTPSLMDQFFKIPFATFFKVARDFEKKHEVLKRNEILRNLGNTLWETSIECISNEFSEEEKNQIAKLMESEDFISSKEKFLIWIERISYACTFFPEFVHEDLLKKLNAIDFPKELCGTEELSLPYTITNIAQSLVDKIKKNYCNQEIPVTIAISLALNRDIFKNITNEKIFLNLIQNTLLTQVKKQLGDKLSSHFKNLYAVIIDTCWYGWFPEVKSQKAYKDYISTNICIYNANNELVKNNIKIYEKIPLEVSITLNFETFGH